MIAGRLVISGAHDGRLAERPKRIAVSFLTA
jgi:hypothetical protein